MNYYEEVYLKSSLQRTYIVMVYSYDVILIKCYVI